MKDWVRGGLIGAAIFLVLYLIFSFTGIRFTNIFLYLIIAIVIGALLGLFFNKISSHLISMGIMTLLIGFVSIFLSCGKGSGFCGFQIIPFTILSGLLILIGLIMMTINWLKSKYDSSK